MQPRPIAEALKTATIFAKFGDKYFVAKWNPDKGRRPAPYWEPFPRAASPYSNENWVRSHQPTEYRDMAEILAATPMPAPPIQTPPVPVPAQPPPLIKPPANPPPTVIVISDVTGTVEVGRDFELGEIKGNPQPCLGGKAVAYALGNVTRDSSGGIKHALTQFVVPSKMPLELTWVDSPVAPPAMIS